MLSLLSTNTPGHNIASRNTMVRTSRVVGAVREVLVAESSPPGLQYTVSGGYGLGRAGQLIVQPAAIIHLDCIQVSGRREE